MERKKPRHTTGGHVLPEAAPVDFVLHAPGRDYDLMADVEVIDIEFEDDELDAVEPDPDAVTRPRARVPSARYTVGLTWWQAARDGLRVLEDPEDTLS